MANRSGGKVKPGRAHETDVYFVPEVAELIIKKLLCHLPPRRSRLRIMDACAGNGVLGVAMRKVILEKTEHGITGMAFVEKKHGVDILTYKDRGGFDVIICNPPWVPVELAEKIYYKCLSLLNDGGVMFYIINNTYVYQGWQRAIKLTFQKYYFLPRYVFSWQNKKKLLDCGVMACHRGKMPAAAAHQNCYIHIPKDIYTMRLLDE